MYYGADISFIDSHTKRNCGDNNLDIILYEQFLMKIAITVVQSRMIGFRRHPIALKYQSQFIDLFF